MRANKKKVTVHAIQELRVVHDRVGRFAMFLRNVDGVAPEVQRRLKEAQASLRFAASILREGEHEGGFPSRFQDAVTPAVFWIDWAAMQFNHVVSDRAYVSRFLSECVDRVLRVVSDWDLENRRQFDSASVPPPPPSELEEQLSRLLRLLQRRRLLAS